MTQRLERLRGNLTTVLTPGDRDLVYFGFPAPIDGVVNIEIDSGNDNVEVEVLPVCAAGQPRYTRCDSSSGEAFINAGAACVARNLAALEVECRREDEARPPMVALAIALNADSNVCEEIDVSYSIVEASSL